MGLNLQQNGQSVDRDLINILERCGLPVWIDEDISIIDQNCVISLVNLSMIHNENECEEYGGILKTYDEMNLVNIFLVNESIDSDLEHNFKKMDAFLIKEKLLLEILTDFMSPDDLLKYYIKVITKKEERVESEESQETRNCRRKYFCRDLKEIYLKLKENKDIKDRFGEIDRKLKERS